jgi:hypothetical protein
MSETNSQIPFHVELRRLPHDGDRARHRLRFGVVGVDQPASVIFENDLFTDPVIIERESDGGIELPDLYFDILAKKSFNLMAGLIAEQDGESGWWTIRDVTSAIQHGIDSADAGQIIQSLIARISAKHSVEKSVCMVVDDDAALDAVPVPNLSE